MKLRILTIPAIAALGIAAFTLTGTAAPDSTPTVTVAAQVAPDAPVPAVVAPEPTVAPEAAPGAAQPAQRSLAVIPADDHVDRTLVPVPAPAPVGPTTFCRVTHYGDDTLDAWTAAGATGLPLGTVFTWTLTADGVTHSVPLTVHEGSVMVAGLSYGSDYAPGATVFGTSQDQVIYLHGPHGPVLTSVSVGGSTVC